MSDNPFFSPNMSSDDIYLGQDMTVCLTDEVNDKATLDHTHDGYAAATDLDLLEDVVDTKADATHTHDYASTTHTHDDYATTTALDILGIKVDGKADASHTHSGYAEATHTHTEYSATTHNHDDDYSAVGHTHSGYVTTTELDEVSDAISNKADSSHTHTGVYDVNGAASTAETNANAYTDTAIANLLNNSTTAVDSIYELRDAMEENADAITALETIAASKASATDLTSHTSDTTIHITSTERTNWDAAKTHADTAHAPSNAEKNQNAFSNVVIGSTTIAADATTDTLTLVAGSNVTITPDASSDSITIAATDTVYTLPSAGSSLGGVKTGGDVTISSGVITVNDDSHAHVISNIDGLQTILDAKAASTHNHDSVYDTKGSAEAAADVVQGNLDVVSDELTDHINNSDIHFTATERTKLSGIATGANNYTHPNSGVTAGTYKSVTVNAQGHVTGGTNPTTLAGYGITDAESKGAADTALASAKEYTDDAVADEVVARDSAIATAKSSAISTAASDATTKANNALASAKTYADNAATTVKNDLLNNAGSAYDTLKELGDLIDDNTDAIDALESVAANKANASDLTTHTSNTSNPHGVTLTQLGVTATATELNYVDGVTSAIQTQLNAKAASSHSHAASDITSGTLSSDRLPTVPISKGGTGATTAATALTNLGLTATAAELNKMDGVTATTAELNYVDGVTSNIQTQLDTLTTTVSGKADASHGTHVTYSTTVPKANGTAAVGTASTVSRSDHVHPLQTTVSGNAGTATKLATARTITLAGDVTGSASFDGSANVSITATVADDSHNHTIANIDNLQTTLNTKSDNDHRHTPITIAVEDEDLDNYTSAGLYSFAYAYSPANVPSGNTNGWLLVIPWSGTNSNTVKQIWFRHGTLNSNDFETYVRTKIGDSGWSSWSKYYTSSNPPTPAEIGAATAFTTSTGGVEILVYTADNKNLLDIINGLDVGVHTIYSQGGVSGNPKTTESWRLLVHKTSDTIAWVMAFGSSGSVYANYMNEANTFRGWKCVYEATNSMVLWSGAYYMHSPSSTPQVVTPSKKLSECRTGWLLLWSDYDASTSTTNDSDFCTTYIPKYTPSGGTWGGKAFYCDIPMYVGSDVTDLSTETRCIKPIYVHDDHIEGSYQNNQGGRNDVVLRAIYEV